MADVPKLKKKRELMAPNRVGSLGKAVLMGGVALAGLSATPSAPVLPNRDARPSGGKYADQRGRSFGITVRREQCCPCSTCKPCLARFSCVARLSRLQQFRIIDDY